MRVFCGVLSDGCRPSLEANISSPPTGMSCSQSIPSPSSPFSSPISQDNTPSTPVYPRLSTLHDFHLLGLTWYGNIIVLKRNDLKTLIGTSCPARIGLKICNMSTCRVVEKSNCHKDERRAKEHARKEDTAWDSTRTTGT
jgi:hypothetical protein